MTIGAHLLGIPLLLLCLVPEYRAWRRRTAAPEVMTEPENEFYFHSDNGTARVAVLANAVMGNQRW